MICEPMRREHIEEISILFLVNIHHWAHGFAKETRAGDGVSLVLVARLFDL